MKFDATIFWEILKSIALLLIGVLINYFFEKRSKLISYYGHISAFSHTPPQGGGPINVFSHTVILRNSGRASATNIRIHHKDLPDFNIWPSILYSVETLPDGTKDIVIPSMVQKEQITISYLYFPPLTYDKTNSGIKCDQGFAQQINVLLQAKVPQWLIYLLRIFLLIGIITGIYFSYHMCIWLLGKIS